MVFLQPGKSVSLILKITSKTVNRLVSNCAGTKEQSRGVQGNN